MSFMFGVGAIIAVFVIPIVGGLTGAVGLLVGLVGLISILTSGGKRMGQKFALYGIGLSLVSMAIFFGVVGGFSR